MIPDLTVRHALMLSYPAAGRDEQRVAGHVRYWIRHADVVVLGFVSEGIGRWDVVQGSKACIDINQWRARLAYAENDGKNGTVRVLHAPNHRGAKGTEFLIRAVERLKEEGLAVELLLVEKKQNQEVRALMQQVDILADQLVLPGYGMAAIEGMASGLPVISNLELDSYTRIFRRYSFLNECPILAASPETIERNLRTLVRNPSLRRELGRAGRAYVEKYHSYATAQHLFGAIYRKLLDGEDVDLMNLFHPLKSSYNRATPEVVHPLVESRLPPHYPLQC
jgi:glycosyltransferase involved in cell wall biosynthesis